jgi:UDP-N-acetyl-D-mannosaminuronate dehydrogenase
VKSRREPWEEQSSRSPQPSEHKAGKPVNGARIALFGVSYKPGVGDIREYPALKIIKLLANHGAELCYHDPHVPHSPISH